MNRWQKECPVHILTMNRWQKSCSIFWPCTGGKKSVHTLTMNRWQKECPIHVLTINKWPTDIFTFMGTFGAKNKSKPPASQEYSSHVLTLLGFDSLHLLHLMHLKIQAMMCFVVGGCCLVWGGGGGGVFSGNYDAIFMLCITWNVTTLSVSM